jgi:DNA helicase HerA-like ATPase
MQSPVIIKYGLADLERGELIAALYRADEEPSEQQINLINAYLDAYPKKSFNEMINDLRQLAQASSRSTPRQMQAAPQIGQWDERTVNAVWRRLTGFLSKATKIIERRQPTVYAAIKFSALIEGLNVIQLNRLHDTEKRLLVNAVLREVSNGLELPQERRHLDRVIVVVDELNKYAPRKWSPIKDQIIDVVARGRDLKLSLVGAQQFASDIDNEVLGNSTTRVVGRSDPSEVSRTEVYAQLGDLREITPYLEKGQMVLYHPVHPAPFIIWFPTPLHEVGLAVEGIV